MKGKSKGKHQCYAVVHAPMKKLFTRCKGSIQLLMATFAAIRNLLIFAYSRLLHNLWHQCTSFWEVIVGGDSYTAEYRFFLGPICCRLLVSFAVGILLMKNGVSKRIRCVIKLPLL